IAIQIYELKRGTVFHMRMNLKSKTTQLNHGVARWIAVLSITATFITTLLCASLITHTLHLPFALPHLGGQTTMATNGPPKWENDEMITAPVTNFSSPSSRTLSVSPLFTRTYQTYGTSHNGLGTPITTAFPTTDGWLQFFVNGALLLPAQTQDD